MWRRFEDDFVWLQLPPAGFRSPGRSVSQRADPVRWRLHLAAAVYSLNKELQGETVGTTRALRHYGCSNPTSTDFAVVKRVKLEIQQRAGWEAIVASAPAQPAPAAAAVAVLEPLSLAPSHSMVTVSPPARAEDMEAFVFASVGHEALVVFLSQYMKTKGVTQGKVAEKMGVSSAMLSKWTNGGGRLTAEAEMRVDAKVAALLSGKPATSEAPAPAPATTPAPAAPPTPMAVSAAAGVGAGSAGKRTRTVDTPAPAPQRAPVSASAAGKLPKTAGGQLLLGTRVRVWWEDDERWFDGTVREYSSASDAYLVRYDDGDQRYEPLGNPDIVWELSPPTDPKPGADKRARVSGEFATPAPRAPAPSQPAAAATLTDAPKQLASLCQYVDTLPLAHERGGSAQLMCGWSAKSQERRAGGHHTGTDTYFFSPAGKRFRSRVEVVKFLELHEAR